MECLDDLERICIQDLHISFRFAGDKASAILQFTEPLLVDERHLFARRCHTDLPVIQRRVGSGRHFSRHQEMKVGVIERQKASGTNHESSVMGRRDAGKVCGGHELEALDLNARFHVEHACDEDKVSSAATGSPCGKGRGLSSAIYLVDQEPLWREKDYSLLRQPHEVSGPVK